MTNREEIVNLASDLIFYRESSRGLPEKRGLDLSGSAYTKGNYHIKTDRAGDKLYGSKTFRDLYSHMSQVEFADFMYDNPGQEELIMEEIINSTIDQMPYLENMPARLSAAVVRTIYNSVDQPNLRRSLKVLNTAIETGIGDVEKIKSAVVSQIDVTHARVGGKKVVLPGLVNETHQLREFALGYGEIEDYDLKFDDLSEYTKTLAVSLKKDQIKETSQDGRIYLGRLGVPFKEGDDTKDAEYDQWEQSIYHKAYERDFGGEEQDLIAENRPGFAETVMAARVGLPTVVAGLSYIASKFGAFDQNLGTITPPKPRPERD